MNVKSFTQNASAMLFVLNALLLFLCSCTRPNIESEMSQALALAKEGKYSEALSHTEQCLRFSPESVNAMLLHGFCQYSQPTAGGTSKAAAYKIFERATKMAPERFDVWYFYGWSLYENDMNHGAIAPLEKALSLLPSTSPLRNQLRLMIGRCCAHNNLQQKAMQYLQPLRVFKPYSEYPEIYNSLGLLALKRGESQEAINQFAKAYTLDKGNPAVLQNIAVTCDLYMNQPGAAKTYYTLALEAWGRKASPMQKLNIRNRIATLAELEDRR